MDCAYFLVYNGICSPACQSLSFGNSYIPGGGMNTLDRIVYQDRHMAGRHS